MDAVATDEIARPPSETDHEWASPSASPIRARGGEPSPRVLHLEDEEDLEELVSELGEGASACPRCGELRWERSSTSCKGCGLIFERWRAVQARRRRAIRAALELKARRLALLGSVLFLGLGIALVVHLVRTDQLGVPAALRPSPRPEGSVVAVDQARAVELAVARLEARPSPAPSPVPSDWSGYQSDLARALTSLGPIRFPDVGVSSVERERLRLDARVQEQRIEELLAPHLAADRLSARALRALTSVRVARIDAESHGRDGAAARLANLDARLEAIVERAIDRERREDLERLERDPRIRRDVVEAHRAIEAMLRELESPVGGSR